MNWNGSYAGLLASEHIGTNSYYDNDVITSYSPFERKGAMGGVYFGYLIERDTYVYGAELSLSSGKLKMDPNQDNHIPSFSDFRIKTGSANENQLLTIGIGYFTGEVVPQNVAVLGPHKIQGASLSLGVDYLLHNKVLIGAQYLHRSFGKAPFANLDSWTVDGFDNSIEFRVGYKF